MTPRQKALELYTKFHQSFNGFGSAVIRIQGAAARKAAIIAVQEIIKVIPMYTGNINPDWQFWNDVKSELEKL